MKKGTPTALNGARPLCSRWFFLWYKFVICWQQLTCLRQRKAFNEVNDYCIQGYIVSQNEPWGLNSIKFRVGAHVLKSETAAHKEPDPGLDLLKLFYLFHKGRIRSLYFTFLFEHPVSSGVDGVALIYSRTFSFSFFNSSWPFKVTFNRFKHRLCYSTLSRCVSLTPRKPQKREFKHMNVEKTLQILQIQMCGERSSLQRATVFFRIYTSWDHSPQTRWHGTEWYWTSFIWWFYDYVMLSYSSCAYQFLMETPISLIFCHFR